MNLIKTKFKEIEYKINKGFLLKFPVEESQKLELLKEIMLNNQVYVYLSSEYKDAVAFVVLLLILFFFPGGLFGAKKSKRV